MKKITKICALAGVYLILSVSLAGIVNATTLSTGDTGTLSQTLLGFSDNITITDVSMPNATTQEKTADENSYTWHDGSLSGADEYIGWRISSGANHAQVNLESTDFLRNSDSRNLNGDIYVKIIDIPFFIGNYTFVGCGPGWVTNGDCDGATYSPNCHLNGGQEIELYSISCTGDLAGRFATRSMEDAEYSDIATGVTVPLGTPIGSYSATLTATLLTW
jgi:hypothetical protein